MNYKHVHNSRPFDPADFPSLREFFSAYLHQDFGEEYGSAAGAVKGFLADASGDEILQVKEEWKRFRADYRGRSLTDTQAALGQLGSTWLPENEAELAGVDEILSRAEA
jgi:hypothetical protein